MSALDFAINLSAPSFALPLTRLRAFVKEPLPYGFTLTLSGVTTCCSLVQVRLCSDGMPKTPDPPLVAWAPLWWVEVPRCGWAEGPNTWGQLSVSSVSPKWKAETLEIPPNPPRGKSLKLRPRQLPHRNQTYPNPFQLGTCQKLDSIYTGIQRQPPSSGGKGAGFGSNCLLRELAIILSLVLIYVSMKWIGRGFGLGPLRFPVQLLQERGSLPYTLGPSKELRYYQIWPLPRFLMGIGLAQSLAATRRVKDSHNAMWRGSPVEALNLKNEFPRYGDAETLPWGIPFY